MTELVGIVVVSLIVLYCAYLVVKYLVVLSYKRGFVDGATRTYRYFMGEAPSGEFLQRIFSFREGR